MRHGFWAFDPNLVDPYAIDFTESRRLQHMIQPIEVVVVCKQHLVSTSYSENCVHGKHPLVFQDLWIEARQPSEADDLGRSPGGCIFASGLGFGGMWHVHGHSYNH